MSAVGDTPGKPSQGLRARVSEWFALQRWPKDQADVPAQVKRLLAKAGFTPRGEGSGTVLTEPIVVFCRTGGSSQHFDLFSQGGRPLGWFGTRGRHPPTWELHEATGHPALIIRRARAGWGSQWRYEIQAGDGSQIATVEQQARWSPAARISVDASATVGRPVFKIDRKSVV